MTDKFFRRLCTRANLFAAWRHVKSRALKSQSNEIRDAGEDFDVHAPRNLQSIQSRLVAGTFEFPPAEGVLKDKQKRERQGKRPRPIVIADIRSRVVQRALLQCLQPQPDDELSPLIGRITEVNNSTVNFGGVPSGGVPKAIHCVLSHINSGYPIFYKSDIGSFFTKVPQNDVLQFLLQELQDDKFVKVFRAGLQVQLKNEDQIRPYLDLFPDNEFGVAQGSSLSAFAGNVFLREIDEMFRSVPGVVLARYIDDVILLGQSNDILQQAKSRLRTELRRRGLSLYDPATAPDKAAEGHVRSGFEYLGCAIWPGQVEPSKTARASLLKKVDAKIQETRGNIIRLRNDASVVRNRDATFAQCVVEIDNIVRGWANSFRFVNNRLIFSQLDREIGRKIFALRDWALKMEPESGPQKARILGVFQTRDVEFQPLEEFVLKDRRVERRRDSGTSRISNRMLPAASGANTQWISQRSQ